MTWTFQDAMMFERTQLMHDLSASTLELWLTPKGCNLSGGQRNCSETCLQRDLIFEDTSTLANCMALPFMSQLLGAGILSEDSKRIADSYGITANETIAGEVASILRSCFRARCQMWNSCKEQNESDFNDQNYSMAAIQESFLSNDGSTLCEYVEQNVLGDIAGIGVGVPLPFWRNTDLQLG